MFNKVREWLAALISPHKLIAALPAHGDNTPQTIKQGAAELVERARQGDQNAMAIICLVRDNKDKNGRAKKAFHELLNYAKKHPPYVPSAIKQLGNDKVDRFASYVNVGCCGEEFVEVVKTQLPILASKSLPKAIVAVANGPKLSVDRLEAIVNGLDPDEMKAFQIAFKHGLSQLEGISPKLHPVFILGHILGTAKRLQIVRLPNAPLSILSPLVGAEFGE